MATIEPEVENATTSLADILHELKSQESGEQTARLAGLKALGDRSRECA
jgi:hypothetical protein